MTYQTYIDRTGDAYHIEDHDTFEEALDRYRTLLPRVRGRWAMAMIGNTDNIDIDNPDGLTDEEREEVDDA